MHQLFRNAFQSPVRGFKKGCHRRFYKHRTLLCTPEYPGAGTSLNVSPLVSGNFTGFHTHTGVGVGHWGGGWEGGGVGGGVK